MKKLRKQLLAILLVAVLILQIIPASVFAEEEQEYPTNGDEALVESTEDTYQAITKSNNVLFEETSLREEAVKHFRMEDGTYLAVRYDAPVHYSNESGIWTDFDNTLIPVSTTKDDEITAYRVENGDSQRTFAADANADELLALQKGEFGVVLSLAKEMEGMTRADQEQSDTANPSDTMRVDAVVLDAASCGRVDEDPLLAQVQPDKIYSALEYENAFSGATLRYENFGNTVKESIVIPEPQDEYSYSFRIETTGLRAALLDDGSITFASSNDAVVYYIPAPYLMDAENEISYDVKYSLEGNDSAYTLTITADSGWVNAEGRAFPVVIDPTITEGNKTDAEVTATYISSGYPNASTQNASGLYVGNNGNNNQMVHTLVHINELIDLPEGSQVTYMGFTLSQFAYEKQQGGANSLDVALYPMYSLNGNQTSTITTSQWQNLMNVVTWNAVYGNAPYYVFNANKLVTDFSTVSSATTGTSITWDITLLAKEWYENPSSNLGFVLRPLLPDNQVTSRVSLYGPDHGTGRPQLTVSYRNTVGIESYYSYQSANIGRAGTAFISDATLHMTTVVPLISSPSDVMPFSLSLVYNSIYGNSEFKGDSPMLHTKPFTNMNLGAGWKLSAQETVCSFTINNTTYLIYTDADGTEHYFYYSNGYYRDEDGLGLKISVSGTNYTMTDEYSNTKFFGNGYLKQQYDAHGNYIYFDYNGNAQLTAIRRQNNGCSTSETLATLTYDATTKRLISITNEAAKTITLSYSSLGNASRYSITSITYPDSATANYAYDVEDNDIYRMVSAYDSEAAYGLAFGYEPDGTICVCSEYVGTSTPRTYGASFNATKLSHNQTRYRYIGNDRTWNSDDDIYTFKVLDTAGRTINSYSTDNTQRHVLGVEVSSFTQNSGTSKQNNRLTANTSAGQQGINLLDNASIENANYSAITAYAWSGSSGAYIGDTAYLGELSLKLQRSTATTTPVYWKQNVTPDESGDYTFSGYIHVPAATSFVGNGGVKLSILNSSGTLVAKSENVNYSTENIGDGWIRLSVTAALTANSTYQARFTADNFVGSVYGDAFQLENEGSAATFNIIEDGSFEHQTDFGSTYNNNFWYKTGTASIVTPNDPNETVLFGDKVLYFEASSGNQRVSRNVPVNAPLNSTFILSAWAKAAASPKSGATQAAPGGNLNPYFGLILRFYFSDGTNEAHYYPFDPYYRDWQYVQGIAIPEKTGNVTITSITVVAAYDQNINSAYIDNISFRMEPAQTYRYDDNGNPVAATQTGTGSQSAIYTGVDLTQYTAANGVKTSYTYNSQHDVETASIGGVTCTYIYDDDNSAGNILGVKLEGTGTNAYLQSSATITADKNNVASSTNANNITTNYWYNSSEQLTRIIDADDQIFKYSYNENNGRVTKIQHYDSSVFEQNKVAEIEYTYDDENLTQLARKTKASGGSWQYQNYYLEYNDWGQQTKFTVGNHTLTTNTYDNNGGRLTQTKFGTYQTLTYTYDAFDRLTRKEYNNGKYVEYTYNAEGALAKIAYGEGTTPKGSYEFEYDSLGRVLRSAEYDGSGSLVQRIIHNYDAYNRLSSQSWVLGTNTYSESYSYSDGTNGDGSLTQMTTGTGATRHYNYDLLKRLQNVETNYGNTDTVMLKSVYGYRTISGNRSSTQVEYHNVMRGSSYPVKNKYAYDARGNISAVYEDANANGTYRLVAEYEYDEQNQLVEETRYSYANKNATSGTSTTYEYIYDTAGNILKEKQDGVVTKTYYYDDSSWIDLLTGFGDEEDYFSYDSFGNPIDYYNGAYYYIDWYNGRQLTNIDYSSLAEGYHDIHYAYDADGIRNWKSVDDVEHYYTTQNGKVVRETIGSGSTARILDFIYDESGRPFALIDSEGANDPNPETYYYVLNLQGDVVKLVHILVDNNGVFEYTETAVYTYDAWGNVLSVKNQFGADITDETSIAHVNPLRYRGYYYDRETGWYYLQSRYYDPVIHRFINADSAASTGQGVIGCNMFAYCLNNPVFYSDYTGTEAIALAIIGIILDIVYAIAEAACVILVAAAIAIVLVHAVDALVEYFTDDEETSGNDKVAPKTPDVTYPGDDPAEAPDGYEWRGPDEQGGERGGYANPTGKDSWHPDLNHKPPVKPHWDYNDGFGNKWRVFPDGLIELVE